MQTNTLVTTALTLTGVQTHADLDIWPFDLKYGSWAGLSNRRSGLWSE